jgi:hypothetical protein
MRRKSAVLKSVSSPSVIENKLLTVKKRHSITSTKDFIMMAENVNTDDYSPENRDLLRNLASLWAQQSQKNLDLSHAFDEGFEDDDSDDGAEVLARLNGDISPKAILLNTKSSNTNRQSI